MLAKGSGGKPSASRQNYLVELMLERITGEVAEGYSNQHMENGIEQEPFARVAYEVETGTDVEEVGFILHPELSFLGASPDGLVGDDGMVEIKCPTPAVHFDYWRNRKVPRKYLLQMQCQMLCTGRGWCDFASYNKAFPVHARLVVICVEADPVLWTQIEHEAKVLDKEIDIAIKEMMG